MAFLDIALRVAQCAAFLLIPYCLLVISYRLLLHPLKNYPGPLLAKFTDGYGGFYSLKRRLHLQTWQDHLSYGPVVRQGPNKLVFNSATALHDIYLNESISKSHCYQAGNVNPSTTNVFNTIDKRVHRIKRKLVGPLITERSMRAFEPKMKEQIDIFLKQLLVTTQAPPNAAINMTERCKYLGLDIVGYLAFGYALNLQTDEAHRFLVRAMMIGSWRLNVYMQFPFLRKLRMEILFYLLAIIKGKSFLQTLSKMIQARLSQDKHAQHDLYSFMVDALDAPGSDRITLSEIWTEGIFFLPAGGDTISTTLSALFFYLSRNPECYKKLAEEVRSTFASSADIQGGQVSSCQYLRACINETLRMSPPVSGTLWREQLREEVSEPFVIDGHVIPPGTQVGVNIYSIHHNPEYFPDPFTFKPERWLAVDNPEGTRAPATIAFNPFSVGSRACAGKAMAYLEVSLTIAKTLWYFDFEEASVQNDQGVNGNPTEFALQDIFTSTHDGPYLKFQPRGEAWKELIARTTLSYSYS
ncbi:benzoate 4-monooxygenase cytochrome P450 [Hypoxylon sp. FL1857]|nr:benzoate 4-monooxygenase cytochrome P450 [Hypoxylon sp. FL1857]